MLCKNYKQNTLIMIIVDKIIIFYSYWFISLLCMWHCQSNWKPEIMFLLNLWGNQIIFLHLLWKLFCKNLSVLLYFLFILIILISWFSIESNPGRLNYSKIWFLNLKLQLHRLRKCGMIVNIHNRNSDYIYLKLQNGVFKFWIFGV